MQNLWVSRSSRPGIISVSELALSLATGIMLIVHHRYLGRLIDSGHNIQSALIFIIVAALIKALILFKFFKKSAQNNAESKRSLFCTNMIYSGLARAGTYLSIIMLVSGKRYLSLSLVALCSLSFILWLHLSAHDNLMARTIKKGRNFSLNSLKLCLLYLMAGVSLALQPGSYEFYFELHFQIFIIFMASLLIFSYFYLHKLTLMFATKDKSYRILAWECLYEVLALGLVWIYFLFMEGSSVVDQLIFIKDNWWVLILICGLNTGYEMVLWEHIRKVALSQLALTLSTGLLWLNIYQMISDMDVRLYISVVVMTAVLLVNTSLISGDNCKKIQSCLSSQDSVKKKREKEKFVQFQ